MFILALIDLAYLVADNNGTLSRDVDNKLCVKKPVTVSHIIMDHPTFNYCPIPTRLQRTSTTENNSESIQLFKLFN